MRIWFADTILMYLCVKPARACWSIECSNYYDQMRPDNQYYIITLLMVLGCTSKKEHTRPTVNDITVSVYASATVKAKAQYTVNSTLPGVIKRIMIEPGQQVKAGETLFVMDSREAELNTANTRQTLDYARLNNRNGSELLEQSLNQLRAAKERYLLDSSLFYRQKNLWEQNIGSRSDFDQRRTAFATAKINYETASNSYKQLKQQLKNELELSEINYHISQKRRADYLIKSEIDGRIFDVLTKTGEVVSQQSPLCIIGKPNEFYLEMNVDEKDITRIKLDERIEITMDSYRGQVFRGRVSKIFPIMDEKSRTFKIEALFLSPPPRLYPNLTAEVNIVIDVKQNAILIPRSYLDSNGCVWLDNGVKKKVITGVRDETNVEILHGLDTSQIIYKPE